MSADGKQSEGERVHTAQGGTAQSLYNMPPHKSGERWKVVPGEEADDCGIAREETPAPFKDIAQMVDEDDARHIVELHNSFAEGERVVQEAPTTKEQFEELGCALWHSVHPHPGEIYKGDDYCLSEKQGEMVFGMVGRCAKQYADKLAQATLREAKPKIKEEIMHKDITWPDGNFSQLSVEFFNWLRSIDRIDADGRVLDPEFVHWSFQGPKSDQEAATLTDWERGRDAALERAALLVDFHAFGNTGEPITPESLIKRGETSKEILAIKMTEAETPRTKFYPALADSGVLREAATPRVECSKCRAIGNWPKIGKGNYCNACWGKMQNPPRTKDAFEFYDKIYHPTTGKNPGTWEFAEAYAKYCTGLPAPQLVVKLQSLRPGGEVNASYRAGYQKAIEELAALADSSALSKEK